MVIFSQLNMQHCAAAADNVVQRLRTIGKQSYVICLQEPYLADGGIKSLPKGKNLFVGGRRPRSCILGSGDLNLWLVQQFSDRDVTTCLWKADKDIYVVSAYLDINEGIPQVLDELMLSCERKGKQVIMCLDSNAHSTLWGCDQNNGRGDMLEDFISRHDLVVNNRGSNPTFFNRRAESIIDITLSTAAISQEIEQWRVN